MQERGSLAEQTEQRLVEARKVETEARRYLREKKAAQPADELESFRVVMNIPPITLPFAIPDRQEREEILSKAMRYVRFYREELVLLALVREVGVDIAQAAFTRVGVILPLDQFPVLQNPGLIATFENVSVQFGEVSARGREDAITKFIELLREGVQLKRRPVLGNENAVDTPTRIPGVCIRYTQDTTTLEQVRSIVIRP